MGLRQADVSAGLPRMGAPDARDRLVGELERERPVDAAAAKHMLVEDDCLVICIDERELVYACPSTDIGAVTRDITDGAAAKCNGRLIGSTGGIVYLKRAGEG